MMKSYEIDFKEIFNADYEYKFFAPGRINLIGSHVDYNGGHVLPIAIDLGVYALVSKREDDKFQIFFDNDFEKGVITVNQDSLSAIKSHGYANYVKAVIKCFIDRYHRVENGLNLYFYTTLPENGGVGITASIQVLTAYLLNDIYQKRLTTLEQAIISHKAVTENLNYNCGIMDQCAISLAKEKHALYLDSFLLDYVHVPYDLDDYSIVICQTNKKGKNVESKLNLRIAECERAFDIVKDNFNLHNLCSIPQKYMRMIEILLKDKKLFKRVKHVHNEEIRVQKAFEALKNKDIDTLARLINESHESLKENFEVVGQEVDTMVNLARGMQGCLAASMTGAGFGGCAIALVYNDFLQEFKINMAKKYRELTGISGAFFAVDACGGPKQLPRSEQKLEDAIESLVQYAISKHLIEEEDYDYAYNRVLEMLRISHLEKGTHHPEPIYMILNTITQYAAKNGVILDDPFEKEQFDTKLMSIFVKRPSEVTRDFYELYEKSPEDALNYFHNLSLSSNYIRENKNSKNINFKTATDYGQLEMSINLNRYEKGSKYLNFDKPNLDEHYPECLLCKESVGYAGRKDYPARQNHRVIPVELENERWVFQYSPYPYFNEHSVVINMQHTPLKINERTFKLMTSFVDKFDGYFIGSNADLPLLCGNLISHEHFHTGRYQFAIEKAPAKEIFEFGNVTLSILDWPISVIKLESKDKEEVLAIANKIYQKWSTYDDLECNIIANDGELHNSLNTMVRKNKGVYQFYLTLRNNRTTKDYHQGIFTPHKEYHHIKKENIGIFEVLGFAILPKRLKEELSLIHDAVLQNNTTFDGNLAPHKEWVLSLMEKYHFTRDNIRDIFYSEIANVYVKMLNDCAVFKDNKHDDEHFIKFIDSLK